MGCDPLGDNPAWNKTSLVPRGKLSGKQQVSEVWRSGWGLSLWQMDARAHKLQGVVLTRKIPKQIAVSSCVCKISAAVSDMLAAFWLCHPGALPPDVFLGLKLQHRGDTPLNGHTALFEKTTSVA